MKICVVTCVWQRPERLDYTLGQLEKQTDGDFETVVIVNNKEHAQAVRKRLQVSELRASTIVHSQNRGPFARIEAAHSLREHYDAFLWVDDDLIFDESLIARWKKVRRAGTVQGWRGFRFTGTYWDREQMPPGHTCHYLWGSNLLVDSAAFADKRICNLVQRFWQCDDLWLCYYANHVLKMPLLAADVDVRVEVDGKDTYHSQHNIKRECLDMLRRKGWAV